ncbi:hypothetical protein MalM25_01760 [Planctomycetes bacterium MalM25]|nr:hypothetical protein MalM25_01760 [Planctomycetes bacterium MalM25]
MALFLLALMGCGGPPTYPIAGWVSYNGAKVPSGWVCFLSNAKERRMAKIEQDGSYRIELSPGEYQVGVTAPREQPESADAMQAFDQMMPPPYVPHRYADPNHTGIVFTVLAEPGELNLRLGEETRR